MATPSTSTAACAITICSLRTIPSSSTYTCLPRQSSTLLTRRKRPRKRAVACLRNDRWIEVVCIVGYFAGYTCLLTTDRSSSSCDCFPVYPSFTDIRQSRVFRMSSCVSFLLFIALNHHYSFERRKKSCIFERTVSNNSKQCSKIE